MMGGKRLKGKLDYSKQTDHDDRLLLWVVTVGGLLLAFYCVYKGFTGGLPWVSTIMGVPWFTRGVKGASYMSMAKSDHKEGGITYETAKATNFGQTEAPATGQVSPPI